MEIFMVFVFSRENYPSTTEYIDSFKTKEEADKCIEKIKHNYSCLEELYVERKVF